MLAFIQHNATTVFFNLAALAGFFVVARFFTSSSGVALLVAFTPLLVAWAFQDAGARHLILGLF